MLGEAKTQRDGLSATFPNASTTRVDVYEASLARDVDNFSMGDILGLERDYARLFDYVAEILILPEE